MKSPLTIVIAAASILAINTEATVITFNDIALSEDYPIDITYDGFNLNNFWCVQETPGEPPGNNLALSYWDTMSSSSGGLFTLTSALFTVAGIGQHVNQALDTVQITVEGFEKGKLLKSEEFSLSKIDSTISKTFNWSGIDSVQFIGIDPNTFNAAWFMMDNVNVTAVPEPSSWIYGASIGLVMLSTVFRRKSK